MNRPVAFAATTAAIALSLVSCSGTSAPSGAAPAASTPPSPVAPAPSPSPSSAEPPAAASCRFGPGTLETTCAPRAEQHEAAVNAAIDRLADRSPAYFDTAVNVATGEWRVLRPREYLAGVVAELQRVRLCAETDQVSTVAVRNSGDFSETWDILQPSGHVRRGRRAYLETCRPPSFPVVASEAIAYVRVAFFGIQCEEGITAPRNGENVLPIGCRGFVTATPKQRNNVDVPAHVVGGDISWRLDQTGEAVIVHDDPANPFNKTAVPSNPGRYSLCATSHGVEGCQHAEVVPDPRR